MLLFTNTILIMTKGKKMDQVCIIWLCLRLLYRKQKQYKRTIFMAAIGTKDIGSRLLRNLDSSLSLAEESGTIIPGV